MTQMAREMEHKDLSSILALLGLAAVSIGGGFGGGVALGNALGSGITWSLDKILLFVRGKKERIKQQQYAVADMASQIRVLQDQLGVDASLDPYPPVLAALYECHASLENLSQLVDSAESDATDQGSGQNSDRRPLAAKRRPETPAPGAHRHYK